MTRTRLVTGVIRPLSPEQINKIMGGLDMDAIHTNPRSVVYPHGKDSSSGPPATWPEGHIKSLGNDFNWRAPRRSES